MGIFWRIFFSSSHRNDILVTSFWRSMNRNNRLSLITGAHTIWSALHLIAGATIAGPNIVLLIVLQSLYRYIYHKPRPGGHL